MCAIAGILFINYQDKNALLLKAAQKGDLAKVQSTIHKDADVNAHNEQMVTSLHFAAAYGHKEIAKFLIEQEADVNSTDEDQETPLILAARHGHLKIVQLLIENGANLELTDQYGATALIDATLQGHLDVMRYLVAHGADIHVRAVGIGNQSALDIATQSENEQAIRILIDTKITQEPELPTQKTHE